MPGTLSSSPIPFQWQRRPLSPSHKEDTPQEPRATLISRSGFPRPGNITWHKGFFLPAAVLHRGRIHWVYTQESTHNPTTSSIRGGGNTCKYFVCLTSNTQMFHNLGSSEWHSVAKSHLLLCLEESRLLQERSSKNYELNYSPRDGSPFY